MTHRDIIAATPAGGTLRRAVRVGLRRRSLNLSRQLMTG